MQGQQQIQDKYHLGYCCCGVRYVFLLSSCDSTAVFLRLKIISKNFVCGFLNNFYSTVVIIIYNSNGMCEYIIVFNLQKFLFLGIDG